MHAVPQFPHSDKFARAVHVNDDHTVSVDAIVLNDRGDGDLLAAEVRAALYRAKQSTRSRFN